MSWIGSLLEKRSSLATPEKWLVEWFGGGQGSKSGVMVTPDSAMRLTAVLACVRVIAETVGSLPFITYRRLPGGGKERDLKHPLFRLLHDQPNEWQTSMEFIEMLTGHAVLRGNGYAEIVSFGGSAVDALIPLHPERVKVKVLGLGRFVYEYTPPSGPVKTYLPGEIFHLRGFGSDGYQGYSPIELAREAVGLGLAAEEFGAKFFGNNAVPSGVITGVNPAMSEDGKKRFRTSWREAYGRDGQGGTALLESGMDYKVIGIELDHAQFLETRKFQVEEICRLHRVPLHKVQSVDHATNNNIEQQSLDFLIDTLRPWLVRWEKATQRDLYTEEWKETHTSEFLVDALLRGDSKSRAESLQVQRQNGVINADEWREIENRNPIADGSGKQYLVNGNMIPPGQAGQQPIQPAKPDPAATRSLAPAFRESTAGIFEDAIGRITRREVQLLEKRGRKPLVTLLEGHAEYVARTLEPVFRSYGLLLRHAIDEQEGGTADDVSRFAGSYSATWATRHLDDLVKHDGVAQLPTGDAALRGFEAAFLATWTALAN